MYRRLPILFSVILSIASSILVSHALTLQSDNKKIRVQVCQNKDCCQRFKGKAQNLLQTIKHLVPPDIEVESSGCLSQCGKGPNICISTMNGEEKYYGDVADAASAGAVLEMAADISIHPTLVAAVNVMERATKGKLQKTIFVQTASFYRVANKNTFSISWLVLLEAKSNVKGFASQEYACI